MALKSNVVELKDNRIEKAIKQFLIQKEQRNLNTHRNYVNDIEHFFKAVFGRKFSFVTVDEFNSSKTDLDGLMGYFDSLFYLKNEDGKRLFSNNTINRKQASIKSMLKFLRVKKVFYQDLSDLELITNLPKDTKNIEVISFDTAMKYAEWVRMNEVNKSVEKYLIIKLAIDSGLRATELLTLKWNQFSLDTDCVVMNGVGKNNKKWIEKISHEFFNEISVLKGADENVFTISYSNLVAMMNRVKKAFDVGDRAISFHSFKKCAVNSAFRLTGDIQEARRKGRHNDLNTTMIYTEVEDYGITGLVSLGDNIDAELYKKVDSETLIKAIGLMNKDFKFILNYKVNELKK